MGQTIQTRTAHGLGAGRRDIQLVSFYLANHQYAVDVDDVFGIYHGLPLIPAPDYSDFVDGEIQVADQRIPVVNTRRYTGLPEAVADKGAPWVVTINQPGGPIGLTVDRVSEVIRLETRQIEEYASAPATPAGNYITAFARYQGRDLLLPDISRFIQDAFH
jgi:purine-binding chemotaxis protein CheW